MYHSKKISYCHCTRHVILVIAPATTISPSNIFLKENYFVQNFFFSSFLAKKVGPHLA